MHEVLREVRIGEGPVDPRERVPQLHVEPARAAGKRERSRAVDRALVDDVILVGEVTAREILSRLGAGGSAVLVVEDAHVREGINGGAEGIRTPDPKTASLVLSQLSYSPTRGPTLQAARGRCQGRWDGAGGGIRTHTPFRALGFEPSEPASSSTPARCRSEIG